MSKNQIMQDKAEASDEYDENEGLSFEDYASLERYAVSNGIAETSCSHFNPQRGWVLTTNQ